MNDPDRDWKLETKIREIGKVLGLRVTKQSKFVGGDVSVTGNDFVQLDFDTLTGVQIVSIFIGYSTKGGWRFVTCGQDNRMRNAVVELFPAQFEDTEKLP